MSLGAEIARMAAIARRDLRTESSYRLRYGTRLLEVAITGVVVYNLSKLVVDAPALAQYGGDYFDFAMVGLAVMSVARLGIGTFNQNILRAQALGDGNPAVDPDADGAARRFVRLSMLVTAIGIVLLQLHRVFGGGLRLIGFSGRSLLALTLASFCVRHRLRRNPRADQAGRSVDRPVDAVDPILAGALPRVGVPPAVRPWPVLPLTASPGCAGPDVGGLGGSADILALAASTWSRCRCRHLFSGALAAARRSGTLAN
jgi:hypothetical protein